MASEESGEEVEEMVSLCTYRMVMTVVMHPFDYARHLMQIGYEPLAPQPSTTFFGKPALYLPNIYQYLGHIKKVDGFTGFYRGLWPDMCTNLLTTAAEYKMAKELDANRLKNKHEREVEEIGEFLQQLKTHMIIQSATVVVTHPLHVVTARSMAAFIGGETTYDGCFCGIFHLIKTEGIFGLFAGVVPRLLCETSICFLSHTVTYALEKYVIQSKDFNELVYQCNNIVWTLVFYPLQVVSTTMMVCNSGLVAGMPPQMPIYGNWLECFWDLEKKKQTCRGVSFWFRYIDPATVASK